MVRQGCGIQKPIISCARPQSYQQLVRHFQLTHLQIVRDFQDSQEQNEQQLHNPQVDHDDMRPLRRSARVWIVRKRTAREAATEEETANAEVLTHETFDIPERLPRTRRSEPRVASGAGSIEAPISQLQQRLSDETKSLCHLVLHVRQCQQQEDQNVRTSKPNDPAKYARQQMTCSVRDCSIMKSILNQTSFCQGGDIPCKCSHCRLTRQIRSHKMGCFLTFCPLCSLLKSSDLHPDILFKTPCNGDQELPQNAVSVRNQQQASNIHEIFRTFALSGDNPSSQASHIVESMKSLDLSKERP